MTYIVSRFKSLDKLVKRVTSDNCLSSYFGENSRK